MKDIDTTTWTRNLRRQITPGPGGLLDKGERARKVPLIEDIRELVEHRIALTDGNPDDRLFRGPRGGRITTAVLRDATYWDDVVAQLGYEHLRRHDLRHTGLTWMAAPGVPCTIRGRSPATARSRQPRGTCTRPPRHHGGGGDAQRASAGTTVRTAPVRPIEELPEIQETLRLLEGGAFLFGVLGPDGSAYRPTARMPEGADEAQSGCAR